MPDLPDLVVIKITPFAPWDPYIAAAEASFRTSIDSISEAFNWFRLVRDPNGIPSRTTNGSLDPVKELAPLSLTLIPPSGSSVFFTILKPVLLPCKRSPTLFTGMVSICSVLIVDTEPVRSLFFTDPYPIITTSSKLAASSKRVISKESVLATTLSTDVKPMKLMVNVDCSPTEIVKLPSKSVVTPLSVPFSRTAAPGSGFPS